MTFAYLYVRIPHDADPIPDDMKKLLDAITDA